ncbi:MAG: condensation domain-containing protein, partial [Actinomycetota bacterium]
MPLTPMQQGMLFETIELRRPWTNLQQIVCRLDHPLDGARFAAAWAAAQARHPVLGARFDWRGGNEPHLLLPVEPEPVPTTELDWTAADDVEGDLRSWLQADRRHGVDPQRAPVQRLGVFHLAGGRTIVVWTFHHALLDGRSFTRVLEDVFDHYDTGALSSPEGETTFAAHARAVAERSVDDEQTYFEQLLKGLAGPTELPIERAIRSSEPGPHVTDEVQLAPDATDALRQLAEGTGTTLYTCVLGAWALLLGRYGRTTDVVFGSTRSGRHVLPATENTAGCLINTVPTRVDVTPGQTVAQLLQTIRSDQIAVRPFEQTALVDATASVPVPPGTALLSTNVVFERYLMDRHLQARGGAWGERRFEVLEEGGFDLSLAGY